MKDPLKYTLSKETNHNGTPLTLPVGKASCFRSVICQVLTALSPQTEITPTVSALVFFFFLFLLFAATSVRSCWTVVQWLLHLVNSAEMECDTLRRAVRDACCVKCKLVIIRKAQTHTLTYTHVHTHNNVYPFDQQSKEDYLYFGIFFANWSTPKCDVVWLRAKDSFPLMSGLCNSTKCSCGSRWGSWYWSGCRTPELREGRRVGGMKLCLMVIQRDFLHLPELAFWSRLCVLHLYCGKICRFTCHPTKTND